APLLCLPYNIVPAGQPSIAVQPFAFWALVRPLPGHVSRKQDNGPTPAFSSRAGFPSPRQILKSRHETCRIGRSLVHAATTGNKRIRHRRGAAGAERGICALG